MTAQHQEEGSVDAQDVVTDGIEILKVASSVSWMIGPEESHHHHPSTPTTIDTNESENDMEEGLVDAQDVVVDGVEIEAAGNAVRIVIENGGDHRLRSHHRPSNDIAERLALLEDRFERERHENHNIRRSPSNSSKGSISVWDDDDGTMLPLPRSTFSLIITEDNCFTVPYMIAIASACLSITCLILSLIYCFSLGNARNPLGLPVDVTPIVRGAQFLGVLIGVLMEDEIPQGLELIVISVHNSFCLDDKSVIYKRVLFSSVLRLIIGYMFLTALFINIVQTDDVLTVFFDVLALQFVESIDDVAFNLGRRGFLGRTMMKATRKRHSLQTSEEREEASKSYVHWLVRSVFCLNGIVLLLGLLSISHEQHHGQFRCGTLTVTFEEKIWEEANVKLSEPEDASSEPWLLVYSYFSGIYVEDGLFDGYPRYVEANKNDGSPFEETVGAEFVYCKDIQAWVFRHPNIHTSTLKGKENECSWLARSPQTHEFDLVKVAAEVGWSIWTGKVHDTSLTMACNECWDLSDCNYSGQCLDKQCVCLDEHFGDHCQFDWPCPMLRSKVGYGCGVLSLDGGEKDFKKVYGKPVYVKHILTDIPALNPSPENAVTFILGNYTDNLDAADHKLSFVGDDYLISNSNSSSFDNYSVVLSYSGGRWYGKIMSPSLMRQFHDDQEYHAFWSKAFENTFIVSDVTSEGEPGTSNFYRMSKREDIENGIGIGPYGVLLPLPSTAGLFVCMNDHDCDEGSLASLPEAV